MGVEAPLHDLLYKHQRSVDSLPDANVFVQSRELACVKYLNGYGNYRAPEQLWLIWALRYNSLAFDGLFAIVFVCVGV